MDSIIAPRIVGFCPVCVKKGGEGEEEKVSGSV